MAHAASLVQRGVVFLAQLGSRATGSGAPGRQTLRHTIIDLDVGTDDRYDSFYPQASSQWDALCHIAHPEHGYYNGHARDEITGRARSRLGIDTFARRGIAGRFVLVDVARHLAADGRAIDPAVRTPIGVDDLEGALARQRVELAGGDILLLRFGWVGWYERQQRRATRGTAERARPLPLPPASRRRLSATAAWLWDQPRRGAIAAD